MRTDERPRALDWVERLVRCDTTSRVSNLGLIETVRDALNAEGLRPWLTYDAKGGKANLFASIPSERGGIKGGTVLSGHTDVVPVDGQDWCTNPFDPVLANGRLYGRGTADMKGFIGVVLAAVPDMLAERLRQPFHLALSFDEEVGCLGAPVMLAEVEARDIKPDGCIIGEPTSMQVITGHKGINIHRCQVKGKASHSSLPQNGANAIEYAARLVTYIRDLADRLRETGPRDDAFDTPFATAQTGLIAGGSASNIVPEHCQFDFEFRNLPALDPDRLLGEIQAYAMDVLLPKMRSEYSDAAIEFQTLAKAPAMEADEGAGITALVRALAQDGDVRKVAYGTEGGQFQAAGIPAVICGPGDIRQAHQPNEYVEIEQIRACEDFVARLIERQRVHA